MSLSIVKPGLLDTIQDLGRIGYGNWGINPGGVMDHYAARLGNMLTGNDPSEAILEIHFPGPQVLFEQNALISISGADFSATINEEQVPLWQPLVVRKNTVLHFPDLIQGARAYISVHGGFAADKWLDSYSTNTKAVAGGWKGRKLEKGDELTFKESSIYFAGFLKEGRHLQKLPWRADPQNAYRHIHEIFILAGPEWKNIKPASSEDLLNNNFIIHPSSDRMGYHVKGIAIELSGDTELISSAVSFGTIQLLPNGQLIILMADHQTTGGYPRIGNVITAHLPKLAQLRPSDCIHFKMVDQDLAEELLFAQQQELLLLQSACNTRLNEWAC